MLYCIGHWYDRCVCRDGFDSSEANQTTDEQQVGGQGGGTSGQFSPSRTVVAGASSVNAGNEGTALSGYAASGNKGIINITSSDPEVLEDALGGSDTVANNSIDATAAVAETAVQGADTISLQSIDASAAETEADLQFGTSALSFANNAESDALTTEESQAQQDAAGQDDIADNALAAAQNETLAGVTPAQAFQNDGGEVAATKSSAISSIATWLTIIVAVISVIYFLREGKPS